MTIIVTNRKDSGIYETIYTEKACCILFIKIKYLLKGYDVWAIPTIGMARLWYNLTGKGIYKGINVFFEKYIPGSNQITHYNY
jgi:hypothetical protein